MTSRRNSLHSARLVEQACIKLEKADSSEQRREAEQFLMEFRKSPNPYNICKHILDKSSNSTAQFQAVSTMRDALLKEWTNLPKDYAPALRNELVGFAATRSNKFPSFVSNQLLHLCGVMYKRGCFYKLEETAKNMVMQISHLVAASDLDKKATGFGLAIAVLNEYSSTRGTSIGMPFAFHSNCSKNLETHCLLPIFLALVPQLDKLVKASADKGADPKIPGLISSVVKAIEMILSWDFTVEEKEEEVNLKNLKMQKKTGTWEIRHLRPGSSWQNALIRSNFAELLFTTYWVFRRWPAQSQTSHSLRECIIQLLQLDGSVFQPLATDAQPTPSNPHPLKASFRVRLAKGIQTILSSPLTTKNGGEEETIGEETRHLCQMLYTMIHVFEINGLSLLPDPRAFLGYKAKLTCSLLSLNPLDVSEKRSEGCDMLLEAWSSLIQQYTLSSEKNAALGAILTELCAALFSYYLDWRISPSRPIEDAKDVDEDADDVKERKERLLRSMAAIARVSLAKSLTSLRVALADRVNKLIGVIKGTHPSPKATARHLQDEIKWILLLLGSVLCDGEDSAGKSQLLPDSILLLSDTAAKATKSDPIVEASNSLFSYMEFENSCIQAKKHTEFLHISTARTLMWAIKRWSKSYLDLKKPSYSSKPPAPKLKEHYAMGKKAFMDALNQTITKCCYNLLSWGEPSLIDDTVEYLEYVSKDDEMRKHLLGTSSWWKFVGTYAKSAKDGVGPFWALNGSIFTRLVHVMCQVLLEVMEEKNERAAKAREMYEQLLSPLESKFVAVIKRSDFKQMCRNEDVTSSIRHVLHLLEGVASTSGRKAVFVVFSSISKYMEPLLQLVSVYAHHPPIVNSILAFFERLASTKLNYLEERETRALLQISLKLVTAWSGFYQKRTEKKSGDTTSVKKTEEEGSNDLELCFNILAHILSKEGLNQSKTDFALDFCSEAVLTGLDVLLLHLNSTMLNYPAVCIGYFTLLELIITMHPQKFARMQPKARSTMIASAEFSIAHHDLEIAGAGFQILSQLSVFHLTHQSPDSDIKSPFGADIARFQKKVINLLLYQFLSPEMLDPLANALLPLLLADLKSYQELITSFVSQKGGTDEEKEKLREGFKGLLNRNNVNGEINEQNLKRFRANTRFFVSTVRSAVQCK